MSLKKLGLAALLFLLFVSPVKADSATVSDISKQLICQCGCTLVLNSCTHAECMVGVPMNALIEQKLAQGQSEEQIIQSFVAQYGEVVLASPPKRGFNLTAWISPYGAIAAGGGLIYFLVKKWVKRGKRYQAKDVTKAGEEDEEYQRQLDKELKEFDERGFR